MAIWQIIKKSFKQLYEHLFLLVLIDIIWFFMVALVLFVGYSGLMANWYLPLIVPLVLLGPVFLSGLHISRRVISRKDFKVTDLFIDLKKYFKRGLLGFLFSAVIYLVLFVDLFFFFRRGTDNVFTLVLAVILLYIIIFFSIMQLYYWGLLTVQSQTGIKIIIKRSFLLTLDNIIFSLLWLLLVLLLSVILTVTGLGLPLLFMGLMGLVVINGTCFILKKYEGNEEGERNSE